MRTRGVLKRGKRPAQPYPPARRRRRARLAGIDSLWRRGAGLARLQRPRKYSGARIGSHFFLSSAFCESLHWAFRSKSSIRDSIAQSFVGPVLA